MKYIIVSIEGIRLIRGKKGFFNIDMYVKKETDSPDADPIRVNKIYTSNEWKRVEKDGYFIED